MSDLQDIRCPHCKYTGPPQTFDYGGLADGEAFCNGCNNIFDIDDACYGKIIDELKAEVASLRQDAERWRWVRDNCASRSGLHMDGTADYRMGRTIGRGRSLDDAVDQKILEEKEAKK